MPASRARVRLRGRGVGTQRSAHPRSAARRARWPGGGTTGSSRQLAAPLKQRNQVMDRDHAALPKRPGNERGHRTVQPVVEIGGMLRENPARIRPAPRMMPPHGRAAARVEQRARGEFPAGGQPSRRLPHQIGIGRHASRQVRRRGLDPNQPLHGTASASPGSEPVRRASDNSIPARKASRNATSGSPKIWADTTDEVTFAARIAKMPAVQ